MIYTQLHTINPADAFTTIFAEALITATDKYPNIAATLQAAILQTNWTSERAETSTTATSLQISETGYLGTARWLLHTIDERTHPHTTARLATWANSYQAPKDAVIGIVGIAIMGPTLGILDKPKKKKKAELPIIIENSTYKKIKKVELAELTSELAQQVHATELRAAGGNAYHMHPDTAEWSFEAGAITLYTAPESTLAQIIDTTPATVVRTHDTERALACSPAIAEHMTEQFALKRVR